MKATDWIRTSWALTKDSRWFARPLLFCNWWLFTGRTTRLYRAGRWLEGARHVPTGRIRPDEISGTYWRDGYTTPEDRTNLVRVEFSGACPVQGEGHVFGHPCYYRSRGEGWQFHVAATPHGDPLADDAWSYSERCYIFPEGGWVRDYVSMSCIARAVDAWLEWRWQETARIEAKRVAEGIARSYGKLAKDYASADYAPAIEKDRIDRHD
jgi:hypothetical protein